MSLRVLTLSTLFPDITRPNFGLFVERQCRELADREAVEVTVVAPIGVPPWPLFRHSRYAALLRLPKEEHWRTLTVHRPRFTILPRFGARLHVAAMTRAIWPLVRDLHDQTPFDVIDASFFYPDGPVARRIARRLGIPYSVKARGSDIHHWGRLPATRKAVRTAAADARGLLAVSAAMKRSMVALGMDGGKITVHYTGVDLDRFAPQDRAAAKARFGLSGSIVLCVGHIIERKGQDLLVRALPALPDVTLILAGQGPAASRLEALAQELGVGDRLGILGSVPHDQLPSLYNAADVMALPSASEGLANAWVEALACGTPILISDAGGARELLTDAAAVAGRIVERTPEAVAEGLREMLAQTPDRDAVRATALPFTWRANGDTLEAHLRAAAGKAD